MLSTTFLSFQTSPNGMQVLQGVTVRVGCQVFFSGRGFRILQLTVGSCPLSTLSSYYCPLSPAGTLWKEGGPGSWSWGPAPPRRHQPLWTGSCLALANLAVEDGHPALDPSLVDSRNWNLICMEDLPRNGGPSTEWRFSCRKAVTCLPASASQSDLLLEPIPGFYLTDGPRAFAPWRPPHTPHQPRTLLPILLEVGCKKAELFDGLYLPD